MLANEKNQKMGNKPTHCVNDPLKSPVCINWAF